MLSKLRRNHQSHYDQTLADSYFGPQWELSKAELAEVLSAERAVESLRVQLRLAQMGQQIIWKRLQDEHGFPDNVTYDRQTGVVRENTE